MRKLVKISDVVLILSLLAGPAPALATVGPDTLLPQTAPSPLPGGRICTSPFCSGAGSFFGATQSHSCDRAGNALPGPVLGPPATTPNLPFDLDAETWSWPDGSGGGGYDWPAGSSPRGGLDGYTPGPYQYRLFPSPGALGADRWPGSGGYFDDRGFDRDPVIGPVGGSPDGLGASVGGSYGLTDYASINVRPGPGTNGLPGFGLSQRFTIGATDYASYLVPETRAVSVENSLQDGGFDFSFNPCRVVLLPTDPNFLKSGRSSWGEPFADQWAIRRVGFTDDESSAWNLLPGDARPVTIAVVDTGLDWHHADIDAESIWQNERETPGNGIDDDGNGYVDDVIGWNFVGKDNRPWDHDGHGTLVAGIIAAAHNETGIAGINPDARIMVLKAVNDFGTTRASYLAEAIAYAVDNGAQIVNLSVGGPETSAVEQAAIDYAQENGVLVVAASGNEGIELADYGPGGHDHVLTVGATHVDDRAAAFSNFGDRIDLVAPGVDVLSLRARFTDANYRPGTADEYAIGDNYVGEDRRYIRASGTSFSTPIVTAVASLVMASRPELSAAEVRQVLLNTADDVDLPGKDRYAGFGLVNARTALGAEPDFFVRAELSGAEFVETEGRSVLEIHGTIDATRFKRAWMQIGPGEEPATWKYVGQKRKYPIRDGLVGWIPLSEFAGADLWQVVVNVEDENGVVRRGRLPVRLK